MNADIAKWKSNDLTEEDRIIIKRSLGYFSTADSLVANNIVLTLYKFITNPECFVEGTEVLLSDGTWKEIKLVNIETDLVAQFDTDTEEISFVKPLKKIRKTINEKVINFGNKKGNVELCVTKNHDLVVKSKINKTIKKIQAKDLKPSTVYYHLCAGRVSDTKIPFGPLDQLKLAFQADGSFPSSYNNGNRSGFVNLQFKIKKERKIERLENICKELNFSFNKIFNEKRQAYNIYIKVPQNILFSKNLNDMFNFSEIDSERGKSNIA
jgi:hypothetical protein